MPPDQSDYTTVKCYFCSEIAEKSRRFDDNTELINCKICGNYAVSEDLAQRLAENRVSQKEKGLLCCASRMYGRSSDRLEITVSNYETLMSSVRRPADLIEAGDDLLRYLNKSAKFFGDGVAVPRGTFYPVLGLLSPYELSAVINYLTKDGLVHLDGQTLQLLAPGYARLRQLQDDGRFSDQLFVAMSFDPSLDDAYDNGIKPAAVAAGFRPMRVDRVPHNERIDDKIIAELRKSSVVVADFTGRKRGVFFEAGFALGQRAPLIWTCREDDFGRLADSFDTRQFNHIKWSSPHDLRDQLRTRLEATVPRPRRSPSAD